MEMNPIVCSWYPLKETSPMLRRKKLNHYNECHLQFDSARIKGYLQNLNLRKAAVMPFATFKYMQDVEQCKI